jgi:magnesium transporter
MISTYKNKDVTWIDLENPTQDEVRQIADKYGLDPLIANDLLTPSSRPIVEEHPNYTYLIFHFPIASNRKNYGKITEIQEIDFILGRDFIITNRYMVVDSLMEFSKTFTANSLLDKSHMSEHAGYIFFYMIKGLYEELENRLENLNDLLKDAEEKIFTGKEKIMVTELSHLNRLLLNFKKSIVLHDEIIKDLKEVGLKIYGDDYDKYLRYIYGDYLKISNFINNSKEYLDELRETNDSLLSTKQNEIMKNLTLVTFIMLPLSLVASIFGMNTENMPIIGGDMDFLIVIGLMAGLTGAIFILFRFTKLL